MSILSCRKEINKVLLSSRSFFFFVSKGSGGRRTTTTTTITMEDVSSDVGGRRGGNKNGKTGPLRRRGKNHHTLQRREDLWNSDVRYSKDGGKAQSVDTSAFVGMSVENGDYYEDYERVGGGDDDYSVKNFDLDSLTWQEREEIEEKYRKLGGLMVKKDSKVSTGSSHTNPYSKYYDDDDTTGLSLIATPLKVPGAFQKGVEVHQHLRLRSPDPPEYMGEGGGGGEEEEEDYDHDEYFKYGLLNGANDRYVYDLTRSSKYQEWEGYILPEMVEMEKNGKKENKEYGTSTIFPLEEFLRTMVRVCRSDCLSMRIASDADDKLLMMTFRMDDDRDIFYLCVRMYIEVPPSSLARSGIPESIYSDDGISLSIDYPSGDKDSCTKKNREGILQLRVSVRDYYYFDCPCRNKE